ncbi:serine/threonine-protein phosphatase with EF-hands 1 [Camelus ferus]|nr:serine/threonine-protein phosphatase with EF-hands 1 [Camelus ferus]
MTQIINLTGRVGGHGASDPPRLHCNCFSLPFISCESAALKAALVIQNWYRGYSARLKTRQRYALTIFQSIEYADEQGQLQLSNFFSFMLENYAHVHEKDPELVNRFFGSSTQDSKDRQDYLGLIDVPDSYCGPRLQFPLTFTDIDVLIEAFKQQQASGSRYCSDCCDLHGKLDDLFLIFYKNGLPSVSNPYVFNGDFVDRGRNSMEVLMILLVSFLVYPNDLHLNRGNHEDFMMNMRYGFTKEILHKYKMKSVLMSPIPIDGDRATEKKNKAGKAIAAWGMKTDGPFSEQLTKHEWEQVQSTLIETVYRYRSDLQIIFNVIDSDHSGLISMEEFRSMWKLFKSHYSVRIDDSQFDELAERMDSNKDGSIDFNEFLKAFYVVHKFDKLSKSDTKLA